MDVSDLLVQSAITFVVGAGGTFIGAWSQVLLENRKKSEERTTALWKLARVLRLESEYLTQERQSDRISIEEHREAWDKAIPYFHTLPDDLSRKLDEEDPQRYLGDSYRQGEHLWDQHQALHKYLKGE